MRLLYRARAEEEKPVDFTLAAARLLVMGSSSIYTHKFESKPIVQIHFRRFRYHPKGVQ